jgi:hypothetical protein
VPAIGEVVSELRSIDRENHERQVELMVLNDRIHGLDTMDRIVASLDKQRDKTLQQAQEWLDKFDKYVEKMKR